MSSRYIPPFFDVGSGIKPSSGSKLFFFEIDGVTPKDTFSDQLATPTVNSNPVISNSNGVFGDIFISGDYKHNLTTSNDIQIFGGVLISEPASEFSLTKEDLSAKGIYEWDLAFTYEIGDYSIGSDDKIYQALSGQMGNDPVLTPAVWELSIKEQRPQVVSAGALTVGSTLEDRTPVIFSAQSPKTVALNRNDCDIMSDDLSEIVGYAAVSGTTGGQGGTIFFVTNDSDDILKEGSFRWAVEQVSISGSAGRVLFDPKKEFNVTLQTQVVLPDNITIDAPGRNTTLWSNTDVTRIKVEGVNQIIRRLAFGTLPVASLSTRDAIFVEISTTDKIWIDQCTFEYCGDGCIDLASLLDITVPCRVTISRNKFRNHDKTMLFGTLACYNPGSPAYCALAVNETPILLVTTYKNWYDHTGQRHPKAVTKCFVHSVNNYYHISSKDRDDGTIGANYGILTATGGQAFSENELFTAANGANQSGIDAETQDWVEGADGPGWSKATGFVVTDGITITEVSPGSVTVPPYALVADVITDTIEGRKAFAESIIEVAGSETDSTVSGVWIWDTENAQKPDGEAIYSVESSAEGRYVRKVPRLTNAPDPKEATATDSRLILPRGNTLNIVGGVITVTDSYHAVDTEFLDPTDEIDTINGFTDGYHIFLRSASGSRNVALRDGTGNLALADGLDFTLQFSRSTVHLMFDASIGNWLEIGRSSN